MTERPKAPPRNVVRKLDKPNRPVTDQEAFHDEKIAPLMDQVIALCKEAGIPFLIAFEYAPEKLCTSACVPNTAAPRLRMAFDMVLKGFTAYAVTTRPANEPAPGAKPAKGGQS